MSAPATTSTAKTIRPVYRRKNVISTMYSDSVAVLLREP